MMKRIMTTGAATLALAAAALLTQTASADPQRSPNPQVGAQTPRTAQVSPPSGPDRSTYMRGHPSHNSHGPGNGSNHSGHGPGNSHPSNNSFGHGNTYRPGHSPRPGFGQGSFRSQFVSWQERSAAIQKCETRAAQQTGHGHHYSPRRADYVGTPNVTRLGPYGFRVTGPIRTSGFRGSTVSASDCEIRGWNVVDMDISSGHHGWTRPSPYSRPGYHSGYAFGGRR